MVIPMTQQLQSLFLSTWLPISVLENQEVHITLIMI